MARAGASYRAARRNCRVVLPASDTKLPRVKRLGGSAWGSLPLLKHKRQGWIIRDMPERHFTIQRQSA